MIDNEMNIEFDQISLYQTYTDKIPFLCVSNSTPVKEFY